MKTRWLTIAVLALGGLMACAPEAEEGMEEEATMEDTAPMTDTARGAEMAGEMAGQVQATMEAQNESGVTGSMTLSSQADSLTVAVQLQGLEAGQAYASHIHQGRCASPGSVVTPLQDVSGDTGGAESTVAMSAVTGEELLVMVHGPEGQPIACGDLPQDWRGSLGGGM